MNHSSTMLSLHDIKLTTLSCIFLKGNVTSFEFLEQLVTQWIFKWKHTKVWWDSSPYDQTRLKGISQKHNFGEHKRKRGKPGYKYTENSSSSSIFKRWRQMWTIGGRKWLLLGNNKKFSYVFCFNIHVSASPIFPIISPFPTYHKKYQ